MNQVLLAGATGLVGGLCLERLLRGRDFDRVVVLARRPLDRADERLRVEVVDFGRLDDRPAVPAVAAICALGTTMKKAGSREAFRAVDHDAVVAFARWARKGGVERFALVSSVGADPDAGNFYLRVKGEAERAVGALGFPRLVVLRPGLLLGARSERRPGEALGRALMPVLNPFLRGRARRFRGISAEVVADALVMATAGARRAPPSGPAPPPPDGGLTSFWENTDIERAAAL